MEKKKLTVAKPTHVHNYKYTGLTIDSTTLIMRCRCGDEIEKDVS